MSEHRGEEVSEVRKVEARPVVSLMGNTTAYSSTRVPHELWVEAEVDTPGTYAIIPWEEWERLKAIALLHAVRTGEFSRALEEPPTVVPELVELMSDSRNESYSPPTTGMGIDLRRLKAKADKELGEGAGTWVEFEEVVDAILDAETQEAEWKYDPAGNYIPVPHEGKWRAVEVED